jgi:CHAT domain-containing protein/tetratricopeptide (TPR) repeat protein
MLVVGDNRSKTTMFLNQKHRFLGGGVTALILTCLGLTACQTAAPTMSVEKARKITADFKSARFVAPPRNINDLREKFGNGKTVPDSCQGVRDNRTSLMTNTQNAMDRVSDNFDGDWNDPFRSYARQMIQLIEETIPTGRYGEALEQSETATDLLHVRSGSALEAAFLAQRARLYVRLGDVSSPTTLQNKMINIVQKANHRGTYWVNQRAGRLYQNSGWGAIAALRGELPLAEHYYRKALADTQFGEVGQRIHLNIHEISAGLARVILQQGRLMEANVAARNAVKNLWIVDEQSKNYTGKNAAPVIALAAVLLEQGRVQEAEYLARIAINMHESSCSEPQSIGITEARQIWLKTLAEQSKWPEILVEVEKARGDLKEFPDMFERQFGTSLAYIEAQLNGGDDARGREIAAGLIETAGSYRAAEITGMLALADAKSGKHKSSLSKFARAMPELAAKIEASGTTVNGRRERIFQGYMDLLVNLSKSGVANAEGLNVPEELLRLSSSRRLGRVQQAVSAGAARAASGNPDLSKVVRQEQDLAEEARALGNALAQVRASSGLTKESGPEIGLRKRLAAIDLARRTLRTEILNRFPDYAELIAPKPMTVGEISKRLVPGQALVSFHVGEKTTFVWAMPAGGTLSFAEIDTTRQSIKRKVEMLRRAVDPGPLRTLEDIPNFDVNLVYELFALLLKPVEAGWKGASELLIVADGPLGALPFSMLAMSPDVKRVDHNLLFDRYREVDWLVNKVAVTNLPSINSLKRPSAVAGKGQTKRRPFVGFGDPFFSAQQALNAKTMDVASRGFALRAAPRTRSVDSADLALLPRLPDTRNEILSIATAVGADPKRDIYLGKDASEYTVKSLDLSSYDVISFATHGLVPGDLNGLDEPALALSSPDVTKANEDGLLTMNEILALKLNAEFAVLSACNTASADGAGAEAVSGLGRAFFYAGAKALLVSNWPVNSGSTTDLMSRLFKLLVKDKTLSRTEALRQTKVYQLKYGGYRQAGEMVFSFAHPIFWAPFTIVGDGGGNNASIN